MKLAAGTEVYNVDSGKVVARGVANSVKERDAALDGPVRTILHDEAGKRKARQAAAALSLTGFERRNLDAILNHEGPLEDWRVGEAYGEAYLTEHKRCFFPWPDKWDERKSGSSRWKTCGTPSPSVTTFFAT